MLLIRFVAVLNLLREYFWGVGSSDVLSTEQQTLDFCYTEPTVTIMVTPFVTTACYASRLRNILRRLSALGARLKELNAVNNTGIVTVLGFERELAPPPSAVPLLLV